jgi:NAD(P)-dependent dehydrogenase (short-subunit alcohol dehydrogenase family)
MTSNGKIAVVTGANRGIGREVARQLVEKGFRGVLGAREFRKGEEAARELGLPDVVTREFDVSSDEAFAASPKCLTGGRVEALGHSGEFGLSWLGPD